MPARGVVVGVTVTSDAAQAAHADNKFTFTLTNLGAAGSGSDVMATKITTDGAVTAKVAYPLTLGEVALRKFEAGDVLEFVTTEAGTATNDCNVILTVEYVNV